jgi:hypothetical protein
MAVFTQRASFVLCVCGRELLSERVFLLLRRPHLFQHPLPRKIQFEPRPHLQDLPGGILLRHPGRPVPKLPRR